jgi:hypothetical protein
MVRKYKDLPSPPETKRIGGEDFELLGGNPDIGFLLKSKADKLAEEWKTYPVGGHARVIKWDDRWWVYGN